MKIGEVSQGSSGRVLALLQGVLRRLGHPALAQRLTDHIGMYPKPSTNYSQKDLSG